MISKLAFVLTAAILIGSIAVIAEAQAKPFFTKKTSHRLIAIVKFDSDCWDEIYARATPKNNNHVLLNKQTVVNNDSPDSGPSETVKLSWYYKDSQIKKTSSTNEGKIRFYVEIELVGGLQGETVTKYKSFVSGNKDLDFGVFEMKTDPSRCV